MVKLTKTQKKRLVREIQSKAKKLYLYGATMSAPIGGYRAGLSIVDTKDMNAIEKMCEKFMKRLG